MDATTRDARPRHAHMRDANDPRSITTSVAPNRPSVCVCRSPRRALRATTGSHSAVRPLCCIECEGHAASAASRGDIAWHFFSFSRINKKCKVHVHTGAKRYSTDIRGVRHEGHVRQWLNDSERLARSALHVMNERRFKRCFAMSNRIRAAGPGARSGTRAGDARTHASSATPHAPCSR